jgi:NitT/TauT family transport system ATP-binding protein
LVETPSRSVCIVFQKANLMPWRTVLDNIALPLEIEGVPQPERMRRAAGWAERVGLRLRARLLASPAAWSSASPSRARSFEPSVLLDEPFGSLDARPRRMAPELRASGVPAHDGVRGHA